MIMRISSGNICKSNCNILYMTKKHMGLVVLPISKCFKLSKLGARRFKITSSWNPRYGAHCSFADRAVAELRERWMEFQGIKNWEGLLDPLDDDLRKEILRYGKFVEAAYHCFDFDMSSSTYATCVYPENSMMLTNCGLDKSGYKVIKNLYATCAVKMPQWTKRTFPNLASPRSSWIGYVAVCDNVEEIARLGRRDVVIAYRGTATSSEWLENLRTTLTCLPDNMMSPDENYDQPMVQSGLLSLYTTNTQCDQSLQDTIREEIGNILDKYSDEPLSITVTGHSLGAALATLTAYDITTKFSKAPIVSVVSFGGPRVGNKSFRCQLEKRRTNVLRIVNSDDPVTKVPGFVINDVAEKGTAHVASTGMPSWLQKCMEDTQWVYAEVGKELRLSSKGDIATCHDLKTYLHLVDKFVKVDSDQ
ncbi:phospholipase A(1) DAD1, chloroplastic-like [Solanum dulcamara]|uniref:phospholipase A(1) DAD1, chloroplastic-like n=1 Tax=Solanum dulcamara TaxID=45834 RepID=UPI002486949D|nr:phospholipase A(1) DAD1, chloroplastic-like [Solanum dulcamara]